MTNKLIVLSMDAMVTEDLEYLKNKPNFRKLFAHAAKVGKVRTVYPSLTYPAHTSIITGCRPGKHGVFDNNRVGTSGPMTFSEQQNGQGNRLRAFIGR